MAQTRQLTSRAVGQWIAGIVATVLGGVLTFVIIDRMSADTGSSSSVSDGVTASPTSALSPTQNADAAALIAAVNKTMSASLRFTVALPGNASASGTSDGKGLVQATGYDNYDVIASSDDLYARKAGASSAKWQHLRLARLQDYTVGDLDFFAYVADPMFMVRVLGNAPTVTRSGLGAYVGTVDLTRTDGLPANTKTTLGALTLEFGADAAQASFEAEASGAGYLTYARVTITHQGAQNFSITLKEFGSAVRVEIPAQSIVTEPPLR